MTAVACDGDFEHPRITKAYVQQLIQSEHVRYITETRTTICSVKLLNRESVTEFATCGPGKVFDPIKGLSAARRKVMHKIIEFEFYLLRQRMYEHELTKENTDGHPNASTGSDLVAGQHAVEPD